MKRKDFSLTRRWPLTILMTCLVSVSSALATGSTQQVLYRFGGPSDGFNPSANVIADKAGNLYGTTEYGGASFYGTVFQLTRPAIPGSEWTHTILYTFNNTGDGARPTDGLIFDRKGNLYGTTSDSNAGGYGEIFELSPPATQAGPWTETVLYHFHGVHDGAYPRGGLLFDEKGNLYGATSDSVFRLSPPAESGGSWKFNRLHKFSSGGTDGFSSQAGLVRDPQGNLYGTTLWGGFQGNANCGSIGCGTVFEVSPPAGPGDAWTEQVIHTFGVSGDDGFDPEGGLALDANGNLYGTTYSGGTLGGGTAFQLALPTESAGAWTETVIHNFSYSSTDGAAPVATMVLDKAGNLYGTTLFGGKGCAYNTTPYGCGVVFELSPPVAGSMAWNETVVYFFRMGVGTAHQSAASLLFDKYGRIYGTTVYGGNYACVEVGNGCGTVFRIKP